MQDNSSIFFINGDIYFKKQPIFFTNNSITKKLNDVVDNDTSNIEQYKKLKNFIIEINQCFIDNDKLWRAYILEDNSIVLLKDNRFVKEKRIYSSIDELEKDYIKLTDFLEKSSFVGRAFRRTKPFIEYNGRPNRNFMKSEMTMYSKIVVLYSLNNLFLVKKIDEIFGDKYFFVTSKYLQDGNYELYGPIYNEYNDKNAVYSDIYYYINNIRKKKK